MKSIIRQLESTLTLLKSIPNKSEMCKKVIWSAELTLKKYAQDRSTENDHQKLKALMKERGLNFHDIAEITGHSYNSVKSMLQPNKELPRWVKLVLHVWENK
tara:strand:+ start:894 stop:1199 length:306 start_codon:yes stop_codon:yes gene_type:complete